jgi:hypothetical protein
LNPFVNFVFFVVEKQMPGSRASGGLAQPPTIRGLPPTAIV